MNEKLLRETVRLMLLESQAQFKRVEDLSPGDVFVLPGDERKFSVQRIDKGGIKGKSGGVWARYQDWVSYLPYAMNVDDALWSRQAGIHAITSVRARVSSLGKKSDKNLLLHFEYDEGPDADAINSELYTQSNNDTRTIPLGISKVEVVGVDDDFVVAARTAPKGASKTQLIMHVLNAADEPLTKDEILKRVAKLEGKPYVPTSNGSYFSPANEKSVIALGLVNTIKNGRRVTYEPRKAEKPDWRPEETIPEDYYAL